mmetsp:Transcript_30629/g.49116  ORF Transcript_30629/g.49116 Transcript_30629/m.49116 type:complete len:225 (+) Transcript_30629:1177-1851(+)
MEPHSWASSPTTHYRSPAEQNVNANSIFDLLAKELDSDLKDEVAPLPVNMIGLEGTHLNSNLSLNLEKLHVCVGGIEGSCTRPFREYVVTVVLQGKRGLQRQHTMSVRYSHARELLVDQLEDLCHELRLYQPFKQLFPTFPEKTGLFTDSSVFKLAMQRRDMLQRYLQQLFVIISRLETESQGDAQKTRKVERIKGFVVFNFLKINVMQNSQSIRQLEAVVLGL